LRYAVFAAERCRVAAAGAPRAGCRVVGYREVCPAA
jgi:hypothetical protein